MTDTYQATAHESAATRAKGEGVAIPAGWLKMQYDDRSKGPCICRAYLQEVIKP
jgi:hypothetical protein